MINISRFFHKENMDLSQNVADLRKSLDQHADELLAEVYRGADALTDVAKKAESVLTSSTATDFFKKAKQELGFEVVANHELHMQNNEAILDGQETRSQVGKWQELFKVGENEKTINLNEAERMIKRGPRA